MPPPMDRASGTPPPLSTGHISPRTRDEVEARHSGTKKRRLNTADFTRRKRTAIACHFCRVRKTKCDNVRPRCSYCVLHQAKCVYSDEAESLAELPEHESRISNEQLMDRLNEIQDLLQKSNSNNLVEGRRVTLTSEPDHVANQHQEAHRDSRPATIPWERDSQNTSHGDRKRPFVGLKCESTLKWPCLARVVPPAEVSLDSFPLSVEHTEVRLVPGMSQRGSGIREERIVDLCHKFLLLVHPRNPVLDEHELMRHARHVDEFGLGWDSASCLVLLACALASYSSPWLKPKEIQGPLPDDEVQKLVDEEDQEGAEAYYLAAQKRLGMLGNSLQDIQCFFFAVIYEKFALRPLRAWFQMQQASSRLQARLIQRGERPLVPFKEPYPRNYHLEQRLFWSLFRLESEFNVEMDLPPSGLEDFAYPDAFPSPPDELYSQVSPVTIGLPEAVAEEQRQRQVSERGWYYYLSEISVRRTIDATLDSLYREGPEYWMCNPSYLVRQYWVIEEQISSWHSHIPRIVQYDNEEAIPEEEFAVGLQGRAITWREYILRPIFYYVVHSSPSDPVSTQARELAVEEVRCSSLIIKRSAFTQRHGGTWLICRRLFTAACVLLAAALHPYCVPPPVEWSNLVMIAVQTLRRWGRDAHDLRYMANSLESMHQQVHKQQRTDL